MHSITRYLELAHQHPHYFRENNMLHIVLDPVCLKQYAHIHKSPLGVIYESPFYLFIVDLIKGVNGEFYTYSRIINPRPTNGLVIIPIYEEKFVLLRQFRHATRSYELEFPRGYSELDVTPIQNVNKELSEEIGAQILSVNYLGYVISDSGLSGGTVDVFLAHIDSIGLLSKEEGIDSIRLISEKEVKQMILENEIKDCFTLSALLKYFIQEKGDL